MRILLLTNRVPWPPQDGGAIAMYNMVKGFHDLGQEVHLMSLNTRKHYVQTSELPPLFSQLASFESVDINTDLSAAGALKNLLFSKESYHVSRFRSDAFAQKLKAKLQSQPFDIIQLELLHMAVYLDVIRQYSRAKVVLRAHNVEHFIWQRMAQAEKAGLKRWYVSLLANRLKRFELEVIQKVDAIVPITGQDAAYFNELGCEKPMHVSPTGLELSEYRINESLTEWPSLFHLGALNWMPNEQGIRWFLEQVWPELHQKYPALKFYLAGRDMPEWIRKLQLPNVIIQGAVVHAREFINSKAMMVVPLLSGSGMRIKIIEGMAMGKTIVSTTIGAEGIPCTGGQDILIADSPRDFIKAIAQCVENMEYAKSIGHAARRLAEERFSNEAILSALLDFYRQLV